jgi:tight adherence protein C
MGTLMLGYFLTHRWLRQRIEKRKENLRLQLPEGVDLLLLGSKAGLDLRRCFEFVQEDMANSAPELSEEFDILASDLKAGMSQEMALRRLADRTGLDQLQSFAVNLLHSLRFGTPIDRLFEDMSVSLRTQRRLIAEEMIEKKAPKLVFPVVLFLFPAVIIIVVGPALFSIFEMLKNLC